MTTTRVEAARATLSLRRLAGAGLLAALLAAVANALVYFVSLGLGGLPRDLPFSPSGEPLTLPAVVVASALPALAATVFFALLLRFTRRPVRLFVVISTIFLVLSLYTPFTVPGAPVATVVTLELMHVVAAAIIVGVLVRAVRS